MREKQVLCELKLVKQLSLSQNSDIFHFFKECSTKMVQPQFMSGLKFYILLLTFSLRLSLKVNELSDDHRNRHTALDEGTTVQTNQEDPCHKKAPTQDS